MGDGKLEASLVPSLVVVVVVVLMMMGNPAKRVGELCPEVRSDAPSKRKLALQLRLTCHPTELLCDSSSIPQA